MPTIVVIWIAKLAAWLSRKLGRGQANALPGLIAEKLQPDILARLGKQLTVGSVLITGTNGKTTTTRMVAAVLASDDQHLLVNRGGSNLTRGLVSALIADADLRGRIGSDMAVFEVDEAAFPAAMAALKPKAALILNLFRDQLDRYGELNSLADKLKQALAGTTAQVVLNADDPLIAWLGQDLTNPSYFGLEAAAVTKLEHDYAADSIACPICGRALKYTKLFYAHVGIYSCPEKHLDRPMPIVVGSTTKVNLTRSQSDLKIGPNKLSLNLELPGLYNVYNALAAIALGQSLGADVAQSVQRIQAMPAAFGRAETVTINSRKLQIFLVKNPAGFNQVIQAYRAEPEAKPTLIVVNDLIADGRDVSWLWDVAFEDMPELPSLVAAGSRCLDLGLRLKYADITANIQSSNDEALRQFIASIPAGGSGVILPTYTAMLSLRRQLSRQTDLARMDA